MFRCTRADASDKSTGCVETGMELPNADVSQVCEKCVWSLSVRLRWLFDWDFASVFLFHGQTQDSFCSQQVLLLPELSKVCCTYDVLLLVDEVCISDDTRIHVLHIVPNICLRVLTLTHCILLTESISFGLTRRHLQA